MTDALKVVLTLVEVAGIDRLATRKQDKLVEERDYIAARLMNGENNGPVVCFGELYERLDDIVGVKGIQT